MRKITLDCRRDGLRIFAEALLPEEKRVDAAVILSHGYNSSHADMLDTANALAENGVAAVYYDFCGGSLRSKSEGSPLDMSVFTERADLRAVIKAAKAAADTENIYLYGESQGGYVSALEMTEPDSGIAGAFLVYPAFCIPDDWKNREPVGSEGARFMGMTLSDKFRRELPDEDIYGQLSGFDKPVILFHGDADRLVVPEYSEKAKKALPNAELVVFPGEGRGFSPKARKLMNEKILEFLLK